MYNVYMGIKHFHPWVNIFVKLLFFNVRIIFFFGIQAKFSVFILLPSEEALLSRHFCARYVVSLTILNIGLKLPDILNMSHTAT